jgi:fumarate reductase flavoprotein subunit
VGVGPGGYYGHDIIVAVTFSATRITAVEVTAHQETPAFATPTFNTIIPNVIQAQSYHVDIFSGATATSHALLAAIQDAVRQATE